ncbi:MAG: hypothetical protein LQ342_000229 [Letrouitia transgressa]|nr:MAG: hypothetical protein LQ342_000229 [Letrouitia transgressa]
MCHKTPLETYAEEICSAAKAISGWCLLEGLPQPSFDPQAPSVTLPPTAPQNVLNARQQLINASTKVQQLATEPSEYLPSLATHYQHLSCIRWLCYFNVLACIPLHGSVSYFEVASLTGVPEVQLRSVARMAMTSNFLCEPKLGEISHNAVSAQFVTNPGMSDWALFMTQFSMPTAAKMVEASEKWGTTEKKNETAVNITFGTDLPLFDFIKSSPNMTKQFAAYMKNVTSSEGTNIRHLLAGFDWASLGEATVVDVGGSTCSASIALANAFPKLKFVVQDLPDTVADTHTYLSPQPESVRSRITTQGHNFFTPETYQGADVYLLRMILHDWPAAEATTILRNLLDALKVNPKARLIIMDTVLPVPGSIGATEEALLRVRDLAMIQAFNSKERELGEFIDLFNKANDEEGGLVLRNTIKPPGSVMSVMEVAYQPNNPTSITAKANGSLTNGTYTNGTYINGTAKNGSVSNGHLTNGDHLSWPMK